MITRTSKASSSSLGQTADLVLGNVAYLRENFPHSSGREELLSQLVKSPESWSILSTKEPMALFRLQLLEALAVLDRFLPSPAISVETVISTLKRDFERMKIESLVLQVPDEMVQELAENGFSKVRTLVRLVGPVVETNRMPILPLNYPIEKDVPALAKVMQESYEKSFDGKPSLVSAQNMLRGIMSGVRGPYVTDASLMSGTAQNPVSACLVTLNSPEEAEVAQLFTHPLYRARGLATTEVAASMNKLARIRVQKFSVLLNEANDVARRLFAKLGFNEDRSLAEMSASIP